MHALLGGKVRDKVKVFAHVVGATLRSAPRARGDSRAGFLSLRTTPIPGVRPPPRWSRTPWPSCAPSARRWRRDRPGAGDPSQPGAGPGYSPGPFRILYYEDPLAPESIAAPSTSRGTWTCPSPPASGYQPAAVQGAYRLQTVAMVPDLSLAGGFTQVKDRRSGRASFVNVFPTSWAAR